MTASARGVLAIVLLPLAVGGCATVVTNASVACPVRQAKTAERYEAEGRQRAASIETLQWQLDDLDGQPSGGDLPEKRRMLEMQIEILRLEGQIARDTRRLQDRPVRKFVGARIEDGPVADYAKAWAKRLETIGTANYPAEARAKGIYGNPQLTVAIRADGSLEKAEVNKSSGAAILDEAALHIVGLAAPYPPFPAGMCDIDVLHITRTWSFTRESKVE